MEHAPDTAKLDLFPIELFKIEKSYSLVSLSEEMGSIEAGKCADFVIIKENPLEELEALRNISMVVTRGKLIRTPKEKKMPPMEVELDKFL